MRIHVSYLLCQILNQVCASADLTFVPHSILENGSIVPVCPDEYILARSGDTVWTLLHSQSTAEPGRQPALLGSKTHALSTPLKLNHKNADQTQIKGRTWAHAQAHLSQGKG